MKREATNNTKMRKLCRYLKIPLYQAVGILELLWHQTAKETPQGDIGKKSNEDIALFMEYLEDENTLINALIHSGWLEVSRTHRLIVHDWHEHADKHVKERLRRLELPFLSLLQEAEGAAQVPHRFPNGDYRFPNGTHDRANGEHEDQKGQNTRLKKSPRARAQPEPEPEPVKTPPLTPRGGERRVKASPSTPQFLAEAIAEELGISGRWLNSTLVKVITAELRRTPEAAKIHERMCAAWRDCEANADKLKWALAAERFFGEGFWKNRHKWPWKNPEDAKTATNAEGQLKRRTAATIAEMCASHD
jgi:hypothetical protein